MMRKHFVKASFFLVLFVLVWVAYGASVQNGFVFDDHEQIEQNPWIQSSRYLPDIFLSGVWSFRDDQEGGIYYRPLMHVVFMIEHFAFGTDAFGYHVVNILLHFLNAVLVFLFLSVILERMRESLFEGRIVGVERHELVAGGAALLFLVHPVNSEAVYWISAIPELTYSLFFLLALMAYFSEKRQFFFFPCFIVSLLCKETAVTLPLLLFLYHFFVDPKYAGGNYPTRSLWAWRKTRSAFFVVFLYIIIRKLILGLGEGMFSGVGFVWEIIASVVIGVELLIQNIVTIFFPLYPSIFHSLHADDLRLFFLSVLVIPPVWFLLGVFLDASKRQLPYPVAFGVLLFLVPLVPALNGVYLNEFVLSWRYLYLPSVGFSLIMSYGVFALMYSGVWRIGKVVLVCGLIVIFGTFLWLDRQNGKIWRTDEMLFLNATKTHPDSVASWKALVKTYCLEGYEQKCIEAKMASCRLTVPNDQAAPSECGLGN